MTNESEALEKSDEFLSNARHHGKVEKVRRGDAGEYAPVTVLNVSSSPRAAPFSTG